MLDLSRRSLLISSAALAACSSAPTQTAAGPLPKISGPIPETAGSKMYRSSGGDDDAALKAAGYTRAEYFIEGDAKLGPYKTRMILTRPKDPKKFSGILTVEIYQTSVWSQVRSYLMREGHAWAMISSRGNQWLSMLKRASPERYADIQIPADEINADLLAQAVALLRTPHAPNPAADLHVRKAILMGYSGDGASTRMFIEQAHRGVRRPDGKPVFDGYFVCATAVGSAPHPIPDLDVPVLELMNENEMLRSFERGSMGLAYRREDGPNYRLWEIAGTGHISTRNVSPAFYASACVETPHSDIAMDHIYSNACHRLVLWVDKGTPPPYADRIAFEADGRTIKRDANGATIGGVRSISVDVPHAAINVISQVKPGGSGGTRCEMIAHMTPFTREKMTALYGSREGYVRQVSQRADELARAGFYLPHDAAEIKAEAARLVW